MQYDVLSSEMTSSRQQPGLMHMGRGLRWRSIRGKAGLMSVCLHWLGVQERDQFKIAVLAYKVVHGLAPQYLGPLNRVTH